jgi:uncharacterized protein (TIGR02598 family)
MRRSCKFFGFSLVEIVVSLGICSFALTAMMGLLSAALGSSKESSDDTVIAGITSSLINDLRRQNFPAADLQNTAALLSAAADVTTGATPAEVTVGPVYFDQSGTRLLTSAGLDITSADTAFSQAVYQCVETLQGDSYSLGATGSNGSTTQQAINLVKVKITVTWPAHAANPPNSRVTYATLARH